MNRAVFLSVALLASIASATEKKTYSFTCRGGNFSITAAVESAAGAERWSKSEPVVLQIAAKRRKFSPPILMRPTRTDTRTRTTNSMR